MKSPHMVMTFHEDYYRIRDLSKQASMQAHMQLVPNNAKRKI